MNKINYLIYFVIIFYIILSKFLKKNNLITDIGILCGVIIIPLAAVAYNQSLSQILIFFGSLSIIVPFFIENINKDSDSDSDSDIDLNDIYGIILFTITGIIAYWANGIYGEVCDLDNKDLLCNGNFILLIILFGYGIYKSIRLLRIYKRFPFKESKSDGTSLNFINLLILLIWYLYIYLLVDGFKDGEFSLKNIQSRFINNYYGGRGKYSMYKLFSYMTMFLLSGIFIINIITYNECKTSSPFIENIKELQYNLLVSTIVILILIFFMSGY